MSEASESDLRTAWIGLFAAQDSVASGLDTIVLKNVTFSTLTRSSPFSTLETIGWFPRAVPQGAGYA